MASVWMPRFALPLEKRPKADGRRFCSFTVTVTTPARSVACPERDDMSGVEAALARQECVFEGDPVTEDVMMLGAPRCRLHLLSNHASVQVHAELYDMGPDQDTGHGRLISRGHGGTRSAATGEHTEVDIRGAAICYRLEEGHRLRLVLTNLNTTFAYLFFENSCTRLPRRVALVRRAFVTLSTK